MLQPRFRLEATDFHFHIETLLFKLEDNKKMLERFEFESQANLKGKSGKPDSSKKKCEKQVMVNPAIQQRSLCPVFWLQGSSRPKNRPFHIYSRSCCWNETGNIVLSKSMKVGGNGEESLFPQNFLLIMFSSKTFWKKIFSRSCFFKKSKFMFGEALRK
jgi:hypothetical protein